MLAYTARQPHTLQGAVSYKSMCRKKMANILSCRGVGVRNGLFQLLTIKTIGIDSIQLYNGYHSAAYIQTS